MDRQVSCDPDPTVRLPTGLVAPGSVFGTRVVLELKFTGRFPDWFRELVRVFNLVQCSAAKYADGVALLGEHRFSRVVVPVAAPDGLEQVRARKELLQKRCASVLIPDSR